MRVWYGSGKLVIGLVEENGENRVRGEGQLTF